METIKKSTEGQVMGVIGIVLGVISLIVAFIPCVGVVAFLPGGLALIFSIISIVQASRGNGSKSIGVVSFIVSFLALLLAAAWLIIFSGVSLVANKAIKETDVLQHLEKGLKDAIREDLNDSRRDRADSLVLKLRDLEADSTANQD